MKFFHTNTERIALNYGTTWYEFQKGDLKKNSELCWKEDSLYIYDTDMDDNNVHDFFNRIIPHYDPYAQVEVSKKLWKILYEASKNETAEIQQIIDELAPWLDEVFKVENAIVIYGL